MPRFSGKLTKSRKGVGGRNSKESNPAEENNPGMSGVLGLGIPKSKSRHTADVQDIFKRSIDRYNVRYIKYLGDGDSNSFSSIVENNLYGNTEVTKLECVGHIQKRLGARLRKLKNQSKGQKLSDGRTLSGKNRLTDSVIDQLQTYYGKAIRENKNNLSGMKCAVWAIYFPKLSTDDNPQHGLCPTGPNSWCKYNKALANSELDQYKHQNSLPEPIMSAIKPNKP